MKVTTVVSVSMPPAEKPENKKPEARVEDIVRELVYLIENNAQTGDEFLTLKKLMESLQECKHKTPRMINIMNMIRPTLSRKGYHYGK